MYKRQVLTGEGGDELFAGYARYEGEQHSPKFWPLQGLLRKPTCGLARMLPGMRRAKIALNALTIGDEATRFANWFPMFSDDAKAELLASDMHHARAGAAAAFASHLDRTDARDPLNRMLYVDSKLWLVDYLLLRGDKLTMANSLEARVPLLDHKLVEFAASLPANMKLRGRSRKYLLKQAAGRLIPESIINRPKQGFPIPIEKWLRNEARPMMRDLLTRSAIESRGLFRYERVEKMMKLHESGYADFATELWGLMSFEMWMRQFVDASSTNSIAEGPSLDNGHGLTTSRRNNLPTDAAKTSQT